MISFSIHVQFTNLKQPKSEESLGNLGAPKRFTISTKAPGFAPGRLSKQSVLDGIDKSLSDLGVSSVRTPIDYHKIYNIQTTNPTQVDIYYLHSPDTATPLEETLSAIQEIYAAGKIKRFGLSNFRPDDVQKIYDIQKAAKSVLPSVFQGNYNAVSRHIERDLFPLLRKLQMSFYAYSPIAGGFLVKNSAQLRVKDDAGRFGENARTGEMYIELYGKESLYQALDEWGTIAKDAGISKAALAYRWIAFHSALKAGNGDAIIVGASKVAQLEESLSAVEDGPLEKDIAERTNAIWAKVEDEAPLDNYHSFAAENKISGKGS